MFRPWLSLSFLALFHAVSYRLFNRFLPIAQLKAKNFHLFQPRRPLYLSSLLPFNLPPFLILHICHDPLTHAPIDASKAGTGSISACLTMILYHLGTAPEWQTRILDEVAQNQTNTTETKTLDPEKSEIPINDSHHSSSTPSSPPSNTLLHTLSPSLPAVIKESLRVSPPFPSSFPRNISPGSQIAIPDVQLHNYPPLPLGTTVQANVYVLSRDRGFWGDDAEEWKSERWLADKGFSNDGGAVAIEKKGMVEEGKKLEDGFFIFGRGHRNCVGRGISFMAMMKVIYAVSFQLSPISSPAVTFCR